MKKISEKSSVLFNGVSHHRFLTALLLCAVFSFVYIASNGFSVVSGNDDYCVFKTILGGNTAVPCIGFFYTSFCSLIQPLFGVVNVYMLLQEIICFFSMAAINYFFIAKLDAKKGIFYAAVFDAVFLSFLIVDILYTYTAVIASTAGLLCLFYGSIYEKRRGAKIFQLICGFFLLLTGSQLRFSPFGVCCGIGAIYSAGILISYIAKQKQSTGIKSALVSALKKYFITGILLGAAVISAIGLNAASDSIKNASDDYRELSQYYEALSSVNDAKTHPYYKNPEKFEEIGLKSAEDLYTLKAWFVDDSFFTVDRLDKLSVIIAEDNYDGLLTKSLFEQTLYPFKEAFDQMFSKGTILLYLLILTVVLLSAVLPAILFPKSRELLIKLFLLAFVWSFYFIISNVFRTESILLLPLMVISLIITLRYDRFQAVITLFLVAGLLIPYSYLVSVRLYFYTSFVPIFPVFVLMIFGLDRDHAVKARCKTTITKTTRAVFAVMIAAVSVFTGVFIFNDYVVVYDKECNPVMEEYIENHPDTVFLVNTTKLMKSYYNPLILPNENDNVVDYGLWLTKAKCFKNSQKINHISQLFKESINSNMRIIIWEEDAADSESEKNMHIFFLTAYYNNHYAESGEVIDIVRTERVGNYSLYAVVSESAPAE